MMIVDADSIATLCGKVRSGGTYTTTATGNNDDLFHYLKIL
jgi:hypothetical protein